jgi:hypothetical protein
MSKFNFIASLILEEVVLNPIRGLEEFQKHCELCPTMEAVLNMQQKDFEVNICTIINTVPEVFS